MPNEKKTKGGGEKRVRVRKQLKQRRTGYAKKQRRPKGTPHSWAKDGEGGGGEKFWLKNNTLLAKAREVVLGGGGGGGKLKDLVQSWSTTESQETVLRHRLS